MCVCYKYLYMCMCVFKFPFYSCAVFLFSLYMRAYVKRGILIILSTQLYNYYFMTVKSTLIHLYLIFFYSGAFFLQVSLLNKQIKTFGKEVNNSCYIIYRLLM